MKRLDKRQKRQVQCREAMVRGITLILALLFIGAVLGYTAATSERKSEVKPQACRVDVIPKEENPEPRYIGEFTATFYCPCVLCCGAWADGITATGTAAAEGRTVAVDPDVIPYGTSLLVYFEDGGIGRYVAEDCGGAIRGNRIDVYCESHDAALLLGVQTASVYLVGEAKA